MSLIDVKTFCVILIMVTVASFSATAQQQTAVVATVAQAGGGQNVLPISVPIKRDSGATINNNAGAAANNESVETTPGQPPSVANTDNSAASIAAPTIRNGTNTTIIPAAKISVNATVQNVTTGNAANVAPTNQSAPDAPSATVPAVTTPAPNPVTTKPPAPPTTAAPTTVAPIVAAPVAATQKPNTADAARYYWCNISSVFCYIGCLLFATIFNKKFY